MALVTRFLFLISIVVLMNMIFTTQALKSKLTHLEFYMHYIVVLGRAQGIYAMSSQQNEFSLLMTSTYNFITGPYNGSSFSFLGRIPVMSELREMPVVGGTGKFRLARGYCLAKTFSMDQMDAVIGYDVTLIHY
ncbi:hypothetical protein Dsin_005336 [Dipteronia sinensis]|uniref:Dirigent protein n=1 Tax=Dipteronia sinensis TaxID=43782 RepID=A0AAE0EEU3_9ROSI|nr:hypothetical protein Dsin_005336 [Dipteronia sinensis]